MTLFNGINGLSKVRTDWQTVCCPQGQIFPGGMKSPRHIADLQMMVMVLLGILVTRKIVASPKIFSETTGILSQKWTFDRNYFYFEMKSYCSETNTIFG